MHSQSENHLNRLRCIFKAKKRKFSSKPPLETNYPLLHLLLITKISSLSFSKHSKTFFLFTLLQKHLRRFYYANKQQISQPFPYHSLNLLRGTKTHPIFWPFDFFSLLYVGFYKDLFLLCAFLVGKQNWKKKGR